MATTRIKKIGGIYNTDDFLKIVKQLNGRAVLVVALINTTCKECVENLQKFTQQLEGGFIDKLPQLVMIYGFSNVELDDGMPVKKVEEKKAENGKEEKALGDSRFLIWDGISNSHGYAVFLGKDDILYYNGVFEHEEFAKNIVDNLRRFKSSIKSLEGLAGKQKFIKAGRSGIIIETNGATQQAQIMEIENKIKRYTGKLPSAVYFCKGLAQEISYVRNGEIVYKQRGFKFEKFFKKIMS